MRMCALDNLNQYIWTNGFDGKSLYELNRLAKGLYDGTGCIFERIPQAQQHGLSRGSEVLCKAVIVCRGCPQTESELREIYDTDDLIGDGRIQEKLIEEWARCEGLWHEDAEAFLSSQSVLKDSGTESLVYFDPEHRLVRKLISLKHYNVLRLALDRIVIHNAIFGESALVVVGFGRNRSGDFVIIVEQPYIEGTQLASTEVRDFMMKLGFKEAGEDFYGMHLNYMTDELYIGDLNEFNVIKGETGIAVIDADCRLNVRTLGCGGSYIIPATNIDFTTPCFLDMK